MNIYNELQLSFDSKNLKDWKYNDGGIEKRICIQEF
jgi:hypothetical protein